MATINLPFIKRFRDRHGRWRCYYRRAGYPALALPDVLDAGFLAAYEAAGKRDRPEGAGAERTVPGSIAALVVAYYQTADFLGKAPSTRADYRRLLDGFRQEHGAKRVSAVEPRHLEAVFAGMMATPAQAANLRKRLQRVFRLAVKLGWRTDNPVTFTDAPRYRTKGFTPWSEADIEAFEKRWPSGTRERRALALLLCTGQRRSDVHRMGRQHTRGGRIRVKQVKGGAELWIKIHPTLAAELEQAPADLSFLLTAYGQPFTAAGFSQWFTDRAKDAGLVARTPHGLRKACGRRLAEAGCSAKQIMAILGHKTLSEAQKYIEDASQVVLGDAAIDMMRGAS